MRSRSTSGRAVLRTVERGVPWGSNARANVTTPRLGLNQPTVGADIDIWGDLLNANMDVLDQSLLLAGGTMAGQLRGYAGTPANPSFSTANGAGIYPIGGTILGIAASSSNVWMFALAANQSLVPLAMNNNRVQGVGMPIVAGDAVNLGFLQAMQGDYLPLTGSPPAMEGPIDMGGNLLQGLPPPQAPTDAANRQYVDALIADLKLFIGTWQVASNSPDISDTSQVTAGDYYIAVTVDPTVPETAPPNIPGLAGMLVHNGDMVIFDELDSIWELVRGSPLTVADAEELFVNKSGDTMQGPLSVPGLSVLGPGVNGISYDGAGAGGSDIAFAAMGGALAFYQNGVAQDYLVGRSGTTMTGALILAGDATQAMGATTLEQVLGITENYLPLTGGELSGGLNFGSAVASAPSDLSRHVSLFGGNQYGFGITGNRLNYNSQGGHWFRSAGNDIVQVSATGLSMASGDVFLLRDPTEPGMAATKRYVDAHEGGGGEGGIGEAPEDYTGYVRYNASWLSGDARYLMLTGGTMLGGINMGANLISGLPPPQAATDAASKQYVDALISDLKLFVGTWKVALNEPDISDTTGITDGDYYIAVTANPLFPETAPPVVPGIGGTLIHNGDMVIWASALAEWELVPGSPLTVADAEQLFVNKSGDIMEGPLILAGDTAEGLGAVPLQQVQGIVGNYLPIAGGTVTGELTVNGGLFAYGFGANIGGNGVAYVGIGDWGNNRIAFGWNGSSIMTAVDGTYHGAIATSEWVGANYLNLGGGYVNGSLGCADFNSSANVRATGGVFYAGGGNSYLQYNLDNGDWYWVNHTEWRATLTGGGTFSAADSLSCNGTVSAQYANIGVNIDCGNDVRGRNLFAYTGAFWDGSYIGVGASWDFSWRLTVDGGGTLLIQRSDSGATFRLDGGGNINAPQGIYAGLDLGASRNVNVAGYVYADNLSANYNVFSGTIELSTDWAWKIGGGPWLGGLDVRMVEQVVDYTAGLDALKRLRPRRFAYRQGHRNHRGGPDFIGLIGQEVEDVLPELVGQKAVTVREEAISDARVLDYGPLLFVVINSLKEIDARLRALEGARHVQ